MFSWRESSDLISSRDLPIQYSLTSGSSLLNTKIKSIFTLKKVYNELVDILLFSRVLVKGSSHLAYYILGIRRSWGFLFIHQFDE